MFSPWIPSLQLILLPLFWRGIYTTETNPQLVLMEPVTTVFKSAVLKGESLVEKVEILKPIDLELACTWTGNPNKLPNVTGYWRKDGSEITNSRLTVQLENEQYNLKRVFRINGDTLGNYSCIFSDTDKEAKIDFNLAAPEIDDKRDRPIVAYVGDSVAMACKTKLPPNTWLWYKENGTEQELISATTDPLRYKISVDGNTTKLTVMNLTEDDSGVYVCTAIYNIKASVSRVEVRVITYMEPLKPFMAIVAEVIILVLLILLYEQRSSRKSSNSPTENGMHVEQKRQLTKESNNGMDETTTTTRQRNI